MPKISVVMPCYNEETNVGSAIESILSQTFQDIELIIIDDCSTDKTYEILEKYEERDSRIRVFRNSVNMGVAESANIGIKNSKGDYIARMDADDVSLPKRLEKQYQYMKENKNTILLGTLCENIDCYGNRKLIHLPNQDKEIREYLKKDNPFIQSSIMFKKIFSGSLIQYKELKVYEDYDLWLRLGGYGEYHILDEVLVIRKEDDNFKNKKVWEGLSKNHLYRMRLKYQIEAMKRFGFSFKGLFFCIKTLLSIFISAFNWRY